MDIIYLKMAVVLNSILIIALYFIQMRVYNNFQYITEILEIFNGLLEKHFDDKR